MLRIAAQTMGIFVIAGFVATGAPVAAHDATSTMIYSHDDGVRVFPPLCRDTAYGVEITVWAPRPAIGPGAWARFAINVYGAPAFARAHAGYTGWQLINNNPWFASYPGYPYVYSYGSGGYHETLTLQVQRADPYNFGTHHLYAYTYVQWSDGHVTTEFDYLCEE